MLLEIIQMWLASWIYIYFAAKYSDDINIRYIFSFCLFIYIVLHISVVVLLVGFILQHLFLL